MNTSDLIALLAKGEPPTKPKSPKAVLGPAAVVGGLVALLALLATLGVRADLIGQLPVVLAKAGFAAAVTAIAAQLVWRTARAAAGARGQLGPLLLALGVAVAVGVAALALAPAGGRWQALTGGGMPWCLVIIPALAVPVALGLGYAARQLAPTRLTLAGAAIGAAAGGIAAMSYALYCPVDSLSFVTVWYSVAIGLCAAIGAALGGWLLRW